LMHLKRRWGVSRLNAVIVTHPHADHMGDIENFTEMNPIAFYRPRHLTDEEVLSDIRESDRKVVEKYIEINGLYTDKLPVDHPLSSEVNRGAEFQLFQPRECGRSNINNHSIVTVVTYEGIKILLTGDNEPPSWNELLKDASFVKAISGTHLLLAPHHGRLSAFSPELFEHISPYLVVISDGEYTDKSASSQYSGKALGWSVHRRNGEDAVRKCVTTRNDGVVRVQAGRNPDGKNFLSVTID